jgi:hypothetical protein
MHVTLTLVPQTWSCDHSLAQGYHLTKMTQFITSRSYLHFLVTNLLVSTTYQCHVTFWLSAGTLTYNTSATITFQHVIKPQHYYASPNGLQSSFHNAEKRT